jgi:hypothetical protein
MGLPTITLLSASQPYRPPTKKSLFVVHINFKYNILVSKNKIKLRSVLKMKMKEYVAKVDTKMEALVLVGNLLAGNIVVDVDTNEMTEATENEQLFDTEFIDILKALGVENVPVEILARCGKRETTDEITDEITIDDVTENMNINTAKGLLHDLLTGETQVDVKTGVIYWCCSGVDNKGHDYATIKACAGNIDINDVCEMYNVDWWEEAYIKYEEEIEKIVNLIRG